MRGVRRGATVGAFIDPRRSVGDIVQVVGRAIRKSDGKTIGTVMIPYSSTRIPTPIPPSKTIHSKPSGTSFRHFVPTTTNWASISTLCAAKWADAAVSPRLAARIHLNLPVKTGSDFKDAVREYEFGSWVHHSTIRTVSTNYPQSARTAETRPKAHSLRSRATSPLLQRCS